MVGGLPCFASQTVVRFSGFLVRKWRCFALAMQNSHLLTFRHSVISSFVLSSCYCLFYRSTAEHPVNEPFCPANFLGKAPAMLMVFANYSYLNSTASSNQTVRMVLECPSAPSTRSYCTRITQCLLAAVAMGFRAAEVQTQ